MLYYIIFVFGKIQSSILLVIISHCEEEIDRFQLFLYIQVRQLHQDRKHRYDLYSIYLQLFRLDRLIPTSYALLMFLGKD